MDPTRPISSKSAEAAPAAPAEATFAQAQVASALERSRLFALDAASFQDLLGALEYLTLDSGERLFQRGDVGDSLYIVVSGRVRVAVTGEDGRERRIADLGPGQAVGEMALLTGEPRTATVYAVRDSQLARLSQAAFDRLLERHARSLMSSFTRTVVARLSNSGGVSARHAAGSFSTLAIVPVDSSVSLEPFSRDLATAFATLGETLHLSSAGVDAALGRPGVAQTPRDTADTAHLVAWLSEREFAHRYTLYQADPAPTEWTRRCIRQADHILLVGQAGSSPKLGELETALLGADGGAVRTLRSLALVYTPEHPTPHGTSAWFAGRQLQRHHHVRAGNPEDFGRLARFLAGRALGLVLGGGGARGFAHAGVIRALREAGLPIDVVGGTSAGALFAAEWALGWDPDTMVQRTQTAFRGLFDPTLPLVSILSGGKGMRAIRDLVGERDIEDLWVPFFAVSANLTRAEVAIHSQGPLLLGVLASNGAPGIYPPLVQAGDLLVDGAVLNNVPVDVMVPFVGGGTIIAVDVSPPVDLAQTVDYGLNGLSGWRVLWSRLNPFASAIRLPTVMDIIMRTTELGSIAHNRKVMAGLSDLYLRPPTAQWALFDYQRGADIAAAAYPYALDEIKRWQAERAI